MKEMIRKRDKF